MSDTSDIIEVQLELPGGAEAAFHAWTNAEEVRKWWGGWPAGGAPEMRFDAEQGGAWRFAMCLGETTQWVFGEVTEVNAPHTLRFSFAWEGNPAPETPVVLGFEDLPEGGTRLTLTHDQSTGGKACVEGWSWSLNCLRDYLVAQLEPKSPKPASNPS